MSKSVWKYAWNRKSALTDDQWVVLLAIAYCSDDSGHAELSDDHLTDMANAVLVSVQQTRGQRSTWCNRAYRFLDKLVEGYGR